MGKAKSVLKMYLKPYKKVKMKKNNKYSVIDTFDR